jgi:hypothetical protein
LVVEGEPHHSNKLALYRVSLGGGVPQLLFQLEGFTYYRCTNRIANFCAYSEPTADKKEMVITSFDPAGRKGKELLRVPLRPGAADFSGVYDWDISADGSEIAIREPTTNGALIRFIPLRHGPERSVTVTGYLGLTSIDWAKDSTAVFLGAKSPAGATLLRAETTGKLEVIWHLHSQYTWGVPSPDGRHLAIVGDSANYNPWIIDNF